MKKQILLTASCGMLLFTSCDKDTTTTTPTPNNPQPNNPTIPTDGWMFNGTKYKQVITVRQESQFLVNALDGTASGVKPNTFAACFKAYPTASGKYKIVSYTPTSAKPYAYQHINDGEIVILPTKANASGNNTSYWSAGTDNKEATVTVTNGKFKIEVPEILVTSENKDTVKAAGTITE